MKMKMKALVAVTALAIGSQAQAAVYDDMSGTNAGGGAGLGEIFLSVVDRGAVVPRSYIRDLGITAVQFRANPTAAMNFVADANLTDIMTNKTGTIYWNIAAASNTLAPTYNDFGYLTTSNQSLNSSNVPSGFGGISGALVKLSTYTDASNALLGTVESTNYVANVSQIVTNTASLGYYDRGAWGNTWNTAHGTEATQPTALDFWFVGMDGAADPNLDTSYAQKFTGKWTLAANGDLNYVVPVPAAVWLLGSALVGLVGVARRKSEQVQA